MFNKFAFLFAAAAILLFAGVASAQTISTSPHNMSAAETNSGGTNGQLCIYCHTPHNAVVGSVPLWNHTNSATVFTMYTSGTLNGVADAQPTGVSLACLSCHDGLTAVDAYGVGTRSVGAPGTRLINDIAFGGATTTAALGASLSNDHPISITYVEGAGTEMKPAAGLVVAQLFGGKVECASCHDVHDNTIAPFMRGSMAGSTLCLECHAK